jgi:hypothetical protein
MRRAYHHGDGAFSVTLDFVQEHRTGLAAESLRHSVSVRARAIRDGKPLDVPVIEVVPGDLVVLSAGDMVPADGLVLEASDLFVKQALLTGESYPTRPVGNRFTDSTSLSKKRGSGCWASPGAKCRRIIPMPSLATKRNWCSQVLRDSSIRPRKALGLRSRRSRTAA